MLSAFIVCVACATAASRTLFAMGREGVLPKAFGHTSPRFKTPVNATICVAVVATVMALLVGYPFSDSAFGEPFSNYYFWATTGTLVIIVVYIMLCIGGIVFFYRTRDSRRWNPLVHVVVPLIGAIVFGAALYGSVHPTPTGILAWTPVAGAGLAGRRRRRSCSGCGPGAPRRSRRSARSWARRAAPTPTSSTPSCGGSPA